MFTQNPNGMLLIKKIARKMEHRQAVAYQSLCDWIDSINKCVDDKSLLLFRNYEMDKLLLDTFIEPHTSWPQQMVSLRSLNFPPNLISLFSHFTRKIYISYTGTARHIHTRPSTKYAQSLIHYLYPVTVAAQHSSPLFDFLLYSVSFHSIRWCVIQYNNV